MSAKEKKEYQAGKQYGGWVGVIAKENLPKDDPLQDHPLTVTFEDGLEMTKKMIKDDIRSRLKSAGGKMSEIDISYINKRSIPTEKGYIHTYGFKFNKKKV